MPDDPDFIPATRTKDDRDFIPVKRSSTPTKKTAPPADTHKFLADNAKHQFRTPQKSNTPWAPPGFSHGGMSGPDAMELMHVGPISHARTPEGEYLTGSRQGKLSSPAPDIETQIENMPEKTHEQYLIKALARAGMGTVKAGGFGSQPDPVGVIAKLLPGGLAALPAKAVAPAAYGIGAAFAAPSAVQHVKSKEYGKAAIDLGIGLGPVAAGHAVSKVLGKAGEKGAPRATQEGQIQESRVGEHPRVSPRADVPENKGKVRQAEGGRPGDSGRNVAEAQKPAKEAVAPTSPKKPVEHTIQGKADQPKAISPRKAVMSQYRELLDLEELSPAEQKAQETSLQKALNKGLNDPKKAQALTAKLTKEQRAPTDEETAGLLARSKDIVVEHQKLFEQKTAATDPKVKAELDAQMKPLKDEFDAHSRALRSSGTEAGRGLAAYKMGMALHQGYDLISIQARAAESKGAALPEARSVEYEKMAAQHAELSKRVEILEKEAGEQRSKITELEAQRQIRRQAQKDALEQRQAKRATTLEGIRSERTEIEKSIAKRLGRAQAGIPVDVLPDVARYVRNLAREGITHVEEVADRLHTFLSQHIEGLTRDDVMSALSSLEAKRAETALKSAKSREKSAITSLEGRIERGDVRPAVRRTVQADKELNDLKQQRLKLQFKIEQMIKAEHKPHPLDYVNALQRFGIFSSGPVYAKIGATSLMKSVTDTADAMLGTALSKVPGLRTIAEKAPSQGAGKVREDVAAFVKAWKSLPTEGTKIILNKPTDIDLKMMEGTNKVPRRLEESGTGVGGKVMTFLDTMGRSHGAVKYPPGRAAWERGLNRRAAFEVRQGNSLESPEVQLRVLNGAYNDYLDATYQSPNMLSNAWNNALGTLAKYAEKPGPGKIGGMAGKLAAKALEVGARLESPVVKTPTNIVIDTAMHSPIGLARAAYEVIASKGVKNLTPAQADMVMKATKKGLVGTAVGTAVWFDSGNDGHIKVAEKDGQYGAAMKKGDMMVYGVRVPNLATHFPPLAAVKMTALHRQIHDATGGSEAFKLWRGTAGATSEMLKGVPFVSETPYVSQVTRGAAGVEGHVKSIGRSFVPSAVADRVFPRTPAGRTRAPQRRRPSMRLGN